MDYYDKMSNGDLALLMQRRGLGDKVQWFGSAAAKRSYLRDWDKDADDIERWHSEDYEE